MHVRRGCSGDLCGPLTPLFSGCPPTPASHSAVDPHLGVLPCSFFRLFREARGSNPSCGVSQGGRHPQVTNCQLGALRRFHQEPPRHQHPSSDNVYHGRPGALWKVSEAFHCPAQSSSSLPPLTIIYLVSLTWDIWEKGTSFSFYASSLFSEESILP